MTKRGISFLILFALTLLTALATGFSEIFLAAVLFGMVLAFALVSSLASVFVLHAVHKITPDSVERGEKVRVEIQFSGFLLLPVITRVFLRLPEGKLYTCADMLFGSNHTLTYDDFLCPHRGLWHIGIIKVRCEDIFGFFSIPLFYRHKPHDTASVLVYPNLYELNGSPSSAAASMEYSESNTVTGDQGDSFSDTRLYRNGDSLKRIHWKMTVRTHQLHTRQYEMSLEKTVVILLDTSAVTRLPETISLGYADMAAECGAALAYHYIITGQQIRIIPSGNPGKSILIRTTDEYAEAYRLFASVSFNDATPIEDMILGQTRELSRISTLHLITNGPSSGILDALSDIHSPQNQISIIFPYVNTAEGYSDMPSVTSNDIHLIPITHPHDITERLGAIL